jgi:hypothetical protein
VTPSDLPSDPDPRLVELALRITDESPVDWEGERHTAVDLSETLERLREIQAVGREHRRPAGESRSDEPAFIWGPLRVIEKLGEGGFGEVWRAWDPSLQREVALKLRRPGEVVRTGGWLREAQRLARVRHPHVLTVYGADVHDGRAGIWTDLVRGRTLEQLLMERGPCGAREAAFIGLDLCAALAAVHAAGLIHGDVKTRNVIREGLPTDQSRPEGAGRIVLMDFGTAVEPGGGERVDPPSGGTPLYAAPEILAGGSPSVASDLYALGVLLYRLVSGGYPIEAGSMAELRARHERGPTSLRTLRPDLTSTLVQVIEQALAREPAQRFRDAADMERALAAASLGTRVPERPGPRTRVRMGLAFAAGAALVAACWLGATFGWRWLKPRFEVRPHGLGVAVTTRQAIAGSDRMAQFGYAVSASGDLDGDGQADLLVGAPGAAHDAGRAYLYRGLPDGRFDLARTFEPTGANGRLGFSLAHLGDINADGRPDFAIGALFASHAVDRAGQVLVYFGGPGLGASPDVVLQGNRSLQDFGYCVAPVGDLNGDGYPDLAVGAPADDVNGQQTGRVFVFFGGPAFDDRPDLELSSGVPNSQFGIALSGIGDFNGDGADDIAVGANWGDDEDRTGRVYVYYGGAGLDGTPDLILDGKNPGSYFGDTVQGLGDFNGDGFADFAVGADFAKGFERGSGSVSVFYGGLRPSTRPGLVLKGEHAGDLFGRVGPVADFNGDGAPDLAVAAIGAEQERNGTGVAYVYFGGPVLDNKPDVRIPRQADDRMFGVSLASVPGRRPGTLATLIVGAGGGSAGAAYVMESCRYVFVRPRAGERWTAGRNQIVTWSGSEPANLEWSPDGGHAWRPLAAGVGGEPQNTVQITVPAMTGEAVPLRLVASRPRTPLPAVETRVAIDSRR